MRLLRACETMGNASVICTDKTGTLTQNKMTVVAATWGIDHTTSQIDEDRSSASRLRDFSPAAGELLTKGLVLDSTAFEAQSVEDSDFVRSKTEVALLQMVHNHLGLHLAEERANTVLVQLFPFSSLHKCMGVVWAKPSGRFRLFVKGAAELVLSHCTMVLTSPVVVGDSHAGLRSEPFSEEGKSQVLDTIESYATRSLRTIGMLYKDLDNWPPQIPQSSGVQSPVALGNVIHDMIWIGVVGIQDPLRPQVPEAMRLCTKAGVEVKIVNGTFCRFVLGPMLLQALS